MRVNVTVRATYQNRLLASGTITGVSQVDAKLFIAQMLESVGIATRTMDNQLRGNTMFQVSVELDDYREI